MLFRLEMKLALFGDSSKNKMKKNRKLKKKKNKKNSIKKS
jgi:hypothetical protein